MSNPVSRLWRRLAFPLVGILSCLLSSIVAAQRLDFKLIVHPDNPIGSLTPEEASGLFLKEVDVWSASGVKVRVVDHQKRSPVRRAFSRRVHGREVEAIDALWLRRIFDGRGIPPVELATDAAVLEFVRADRGAIGYVSADAPAAGVKVVPLIAGRAQADATRSTAARRSADRSQIGRLLEEYETAMEEMSLPALQKLWPSLAGSPSTRARVTASFEFARELKVELRVVSLDLQGDRARVRCTRRDELVPERGRPVVHETESTFVVGRRSGRWVIEEIR